MRGGGKFAEFTGMVVLSLSCLCAAGSGPGQKKAKKPQLAPLPSGPTGKLQPLSLDTLKPMPPQVSYEGGRLTILSPNSTLGDILRAVHKQTGAEIEVPDAPERVVAQFGPGSPRDVIAELLNGSRFNYVLLGSPENASVLTRVVLVAKDNSLNTTPNAQMMSPLQPMPNQAENMAPPPPAEAMPEVNDADDNNAEENSAEQAAGEQPAVPADQQGVKTPQQLLQEMQQRQLQLQQQQQQQQQAPIQLQLPGSAPERPD